MEFDIYPHGTVSGWSNVCHIGNTNLERHPAVFFFSPLSFMSIPDKLKDFTMLTFTIGVPSLNLNYSNVFVDMDEKLRSNSSNFTIKFVACIEPQHNSVCYPTKFCQINQLLPLTV